MIRNNRVKSRRQPPKSKKMLWYALAVLLLASVVMAVLELTNTTHFFHAQKPKPVGTTGGPNTKGGGITQQPSPQPGTGKVVTPSPSPTPSPSSAPLIAPWGTFANIYNAKPTDQMESTCNTTSGATCQLIFTNGGTTKYLNAEVADSGGAVYWSWKPADVGLTPGTWHLTFKAVLGSQTKTTSNDPLTLTISQ